MDVQLSTRTMLELTNLLTILTTSAGIGDDDRYELAFARDQVATRMPAVELLVCAGLLWEAAKYIFASSLQYFHYDEIYGSVGAVVAVLTWSYVSSLVLLFGAQLTGVFHREHIDHSIVPNAPVPSASYS